MQVKKAVFPVAGFGSRFLPATKANPKEMLPIVDKPLIQYCVEEAVRAGITEIIFVTSASKRAIEDHFDEDFELEERLSQQGKASLLQLVKNIAPEGIYFSYVRQNRQLGLGHAILCAEHVIGNEPFAVLLADDLIDDEKLPCLSAMIKLFETKSESLIAVQPVPWEDVHAYGVVQIAKKEAIYSPILDIVEKPEQHAAPSNLAAIGRYVFTPTIFSCLKQTAMDHRGEIQLTNGVQHLLMIESVHMYQFLGKRYDCGSKFGYLQATVEFGMRHAEVGELFKAYLKHI